ncbi:expressed unknown protein [Seminavis robusta]|uniref:Secreted protein n=1 Tax=Seminavis robusta TaxID=568900 RepID=A0A9N8EBI2_9STRA|nr:expressed unknown protein [Seminavis robusta]|eukprot:Sro710_g191030.1 n/a (303) ;mRNA; r:17495-18403
MKMRFSVPLWIATFSSLVTLCHGYVTPTGQFCPHRSDAWCQYMNHLDAVSKAHQACLATKNNDDGSLEKLDNFLKEWDQLMDFGQTTTDFQLLEYLSEPHYYNQQIATVEQSNLISTCRKLLHNRKESKNDSHQDSSVAKLMAQLSALNNSHNNNQKQQQPSETEEEQDTTCTLIGTPPSDIAARPYDPAHVKLQSDVVQDAHRQLLKDHKTLIEHGATFQELHRRNKRSFLKELHHVEERWDIVFQRFQLMNVLNPDYIQQCNLWLADLGLDEEQYKQIHQDNLNYLWQQQHEDGNAFYCG